MGWSGIPGMPKRLLGSPFGGLGTTPTFTRAFVVNDAHKTSEYDSNYAGGTSAKKAGCAGSPRANTRHGQCDERHLPHRRHSPDFRKRSPRYCRGLGYTTHPPTLITRTVTFCADFRSTECVQIGDQQVKLSCINRFVIASTWLDHPIWCTSKYVLQGSLSVYIGLVRFWTIGCIEARTLAALVVQITMI